MEPQMDAMESVTSLSRPLDISYFTNKLILMLTPLLGIIAGVVALVRGDDLLQAGASGLMMGVAVFFAWVLGREVDPDYDYSAFLAVGVVFVGMLIIAPNRIDWLGMVGLMVVLRMVNRIVGAPCTIGDTLIVVILSGLVMLFAIGWYIVLVMAFALILDGLLEQPIRRHLVLGVVVLVVSIVGIVLMERDFDFIVPNVPTLLWAGLAFAYALALQHTRTIRCQTDRGGAVSVRRVQATMILPLLAGAFALFVAPDTLIALLPVWSVLVAVPVYRLGVVLGILR
jgi:hypothetical protein